MSFAALFSKNKYDAEHVKTALGVTKLPISKTDTATGPEWHATPDPVPNREYTSESMVGASPAARASTLNLKNKFVVAPAAQPKPETTVTTTTTTTAANPVLVVIEGIEQAAETLLTNLAHPAPAQKASTSPSTPLTPTTAASLGMIFQNVEKVIGDASAYAVNPVGTAINIPFDIQTVQDILSFWPTTKAEIQNKLGIIVQ